VVKNRAHAIDILERLIQGCRQTHRSVGDKAGDAVMAGAVDHATRKISPWQLAAQPLSTFYRNCIIATLCVSKIRFYNIGGEGYRELGMT
jgi:hypothetical protein